MGGQNPGSLPGRGVGASGVSSPGWEGSLPLYSSWQELELLSWNLLALGAEHF